MLPLVKGLIVRSQQKRDAIVGEADVLISDCGVHAYEEARRRKSDANDISTARYWGKVKSEIGRRVLQDCGQARLAAMVEAMPPGLNSTEYAIWDSASEGRAEAHRLARTIQAAGSYGVEYPSAPLAKAGHTTHPPFQAVLEFIETEAYEVRQLLSLGNAGEPLSAG